MEIVRQIITRLQGLRRYKISFNTRQRMLALICSLFLVHLGALTFGQTLIFTCGTALGVCCAVKLRERPSVVQWKSVISFLPHVAKDRDLFQINNEKDKGDGRNTVNGGRVDLDLDLCAEDTIQPTTRTTFQNETSEYIRLMLRDFVVGWYRLLSDDDQFSHNVFLHFKDMMKNIKSRFLKIDQRAFLCILLRELQAHVDIFRRLQMSRSRLASKSSKLGRIAKKHSVVSIYETFAILHPALQNEDAEKDHLSQLCNALILSLLPSDVIHCDTLVFLLQDILINNVLQPLADLISEPDFLNEAFILLMIDEPLGEDSQNSAETRLMEQEPTHTPDSECKIESKYDEDLKDNDGRLPGMDLELESCDIVISPVTAESRELGQNASTSTYGGESLMSTVDTEVNHHPSDNSTDEMIEVEKPSPSPFEIIEPQQQFSFPMPMTMLEPSKLIPRQASEKASKEDGQDQTFGELDFPNPEPTIKVKTHRRSASTGSNVLAIQTPVSQSVVSFNDCMVNDASLQSSRIEGMRPCFSADCLTELEDSVLTSQETVPTMGQSHQSTTSLSSSCEITFSSKQNEPETEGHPVNAEADKGLTEGTSPSHRYPLIRSETAPELFHPVPDILDHSNGTDIPLEWATWRVINLNIPTTSWIGDPKGKKPVVYFIIKYDLLKKPTLSDETKPAYSTKDEMEVQRRYREFVNLHTRITNNHHLRRNMTGIGNIPKQSMLPISRLSPAMEEQKRSSLETYLKQLLSRPIIHNSREMAEFLAIDGDGHIEFVKKTTNKPLRIDKLLINQVSGIVGTIKTILPERPVMMRPFQPQPTTSSSATSAHLDQPRQIMQSYDQSGPMTEEIGVEISRQHPEGEDQLDLGFAVDTSRIRLYGLDDIKESHVQQAMKFLISEKHNQFSQQTPPCDPPREYSKVFLGLRSQGDGSDAPNEPHNEGLKVEKDQERSEINVDVYEAIFGVMSEALLNQQSFILDDDLQGTLKILIGDLIDKWLLQEVELLFTEAQWGYYLSLLRDLLWPGDVWSPKERETKTLDEINQTKADALHELTHNPAAAVLSVILGEDHLREGISLVLDSLQDQALNKHLLFTFLDHAMDQLVPEIHDAKFQDLLAAMP